MDTQTIDFAADLGTQTHALGVEYDPNGRPVGITLDEWIDLLGKKLIDHYGDDFRNLLNQARSERDLLPL